MERVAVSRAVPRTVWVLGCVSLLTDLSSEIVHSLLPVFLVSVLGVSAFAVGMIEGIGEATAAITKLFSGGVSDYIGRRKGLVLLGYGLSALTKPIFALAGSIPWVLTARFSDRLGKGIRGAPRDALVADVTPPSVRGAAFGLRQSFDTIGAVAGPLVAIALMAWTGGAFRLAFWLATIPAAGAVLLLLAGVQEPEQHQASGKPPVCFRRSDIMNMGPAFWGAVAVATLMTLARFSEAFLILRAGTVGLTGTWVPLVLVAMNVVYASVAYPVGRLSDRIGRRGLLGAGFAALITADVVLALAGSIQAVLIGSALWGLHMGMTQGLLATLVADAAPPPLRGTAFGVYNLVTGIALLAASAIAGGLWSVFGPAVTFTAGAVFSGLALIGITWVTSRSVSHGTGSGGPPNR